MFKLVRGNYATYVDLSTGVAERHWVRLLSFALLGLIFAVFFADNVAAVYSVLATGMTVLAGFTFTALFSDHALANTGLPQPKNQTDRHDIKILGILSGNFESRSSYFISIAVLEVVLLAAVGFKLSVPDGIRNALSELAWWVAFADSDFFSWLEIAASTSGMVLMCFVNFLYLECLYTFYRLAETVLAILERRRTYISSRD